MRIVINKILDRLHGDRAIWLIIFILSLFSLLAVYSSATSLAYRFKQGNTDFYLIKHLGLIIIGLILMYHAHKIPYRYYAKAGQILLYLSIPLLLYTLLFAPEVNNAQRWVRLPVVNLSFQTSDLAKISLMIYLATVLTKKQSNIKDFREAFVPLILPVFIVCALIAPADLSTATMIFITSLILMFLGRVNLKYIFGLIGVTIISGGLFVALLFALPDTFLENTGRLATWKSRIESFSSGDEETSRQVQQANIAIYKGGLIGQGPGNSTQRDRLPSIYADYIFALILEEYGLLGGMVVIMLYLILLYRIIKIVAKSPKAFGAFLAMGLGLLVVLQAFIHMMVNVNLLPVTGLPLPLLSMGGTSMLFTSIAVGMIISVSASMDDTNETKNKAVEPA